jgi:hypothetical protein
MNKKNVIILVVALFILLAISIFVVMSRGNAAKNNVPKDNVTIDKMTKEQATFAQEFARKVKSN